jgi:Antirestriction protein
MNSSDLSTIIAREVPDPERMQILPKHFGEDMLTVERAIFTFMRRLSATYNGGHWVFVELSNGGFYMKPSGPTRFLIQVHGNDYSGDMSADAAGITACLFSYSHLSFQVPRGDIAAHFHRLREFALSHAEVDAILAAID